MSTLPSLTDITSAWGFFLGILEALAEADTVSWEAIGFFSLSLFLPRAAARLPNASSQQPRLFFSCSVFEAANETQLVGVFGLPRGTRLATFHGSLDPRRGPRRPGARHRHRHPAHFDFPGSLQMERHRRGSYATPRPNWMFGDIYNRSGATG